ncbi:serine hydrolase FSH [Dactylonectria estremocensis]|uniref:Serine hydrolase FSH n=1 Tax=Dactylonectria estremocensis TaxID=1079267 RepID=A0A9P9DWF0_9HYPO|nr:serine hydrolase FSH [Dactylonectria estremocensis]
MSSTPVPNGVSQQKPKNNGGKKEVKILMLHGYTQSGPLFRAKTRALEKLLTKVLTPIKLLPVPIYPTAPNRLTAEDIPGYQPPAEPQADDYQPDTWAWWRKDEASGAYRYLDEGMATVADAIREAGGVDAVCGFSQGGALAGLVAAALEDRPLPEGHEGDWARGLRVANSGKPVKFAVSYSGFFAPVESLQFCYEPNIKTPTLHYLGSLDTVVEESRSQALVDRCEEPVVVIHPGGHHVPVSKEWVMPLAGFIKQHAYEEDPKSQI